MSLFAMIDLAGMGRLVRVKFRDYLLDLPFKLIRGPGYLRVLHLHKL